MLVTALRLFPTNGGFVLAALIMLSTPAAIRAQSAVTATTLFTFRQNPDDVGDNAAALALGSDGNFYGVTTNEGANLEGSVYRITPTGVVEVLHSFDDSDGSSASTALVRGADGAFYGTTSSGGTNYSGTVFRITTSGDFTSLYSFDESSSLSPTNGLTAGSDGNLYGTTLTGGNGVGTVYRISPAGTYKLLHAFLSGSDGANPKVSLVQGNDGFLYGTTSTHLGSSYGNFFRISPAGELTTVHSFTSSETFAATAQLAFGQDGNLYGAGPSDEINDYGYVFRITTAGEVTILHHFTQYTDGEEPVGPLLLAGDGNLYGLTSIGNGSGSLFRITSAGVFSTIYYFDESVGFPHTGLVQGNDGGLYGFGGTNTNSVDDSFGVFYELFFHPDFFDNEATLSNDVHYLSFTDGNYFGYYSFLSDPNYLYHFDLGYEYVFGAQDGKRGIYLYDFASETFFYTSPAFPFPYLYDFTLKTVLYYYPDPNSAGHYNTDGIRYFYDFATKQIITK